MGICCHPWAYACSRILTHSPYRCHPWAALVSGACPAGRYAAHPWQHKVTVQHRDSAALCEGHPQDNAAQCQSSVGTVQCSTVTVQRTCAEITLHRQAHSCVTARDVRCCTVGLVRDPNPGSSETQTQGMSRTFPTSCQPLLMDQKLRYLSSVAVLAFSTHSCVAITCHRTRS